jgi:hypothetical protein
MSCEKKWQKNFVMYSQTKVDPDNNPGSEFGARLRRSLSAFGPRKKREDRRSGSRQKFSFLQPQGLQWLDMKKSEEDLERPDFVRKQTSFGVCEGGNIFSQCHFLVLLLFSNT